MSIVGLHAHCGRHLFKDRDLYCSDLTLICSVYSDFTRVQDCRHLWMEKSQSKEKEIMLFVIWTRQCQLPLNIFWIWKSPFEDRLPVLQPEECAKSEASRIQVKMTSNESSIQFWPIYSFITFMLINSGWSLWKQQTVHMSTILFVCQSRLLAASSCSLEESHRLSRFWWMAQRRRVDRWSG